MNYVQAGEMQLAIALRETIDSPLKIWYNVTSLSIVSEL